MTEIPTDETQRLQSGLDRLNAIDPPTYRPMSLSANFRHLCTKARQAKMTGKGVSTAITLKERYVTGWVIGDDELEALHDDNAEFAILYREGTCKSCREVARSVQGRVVRTAERPPLEGRVGRE